MNLTEWSKIIHQNAVEHGWWEEERGFPEIVALCHAELSEALEEYRDHKPDIYYSENKKPEGTMVELADCLIRILDYFGSQDVPVDDLVEMKHDYNKTRPYKHGGKRI
jgi:hypothetical protein